jgi:DNA adenine methylase
MRYKRPARINIGIELDERVVERWRAAPLPAVRVIRGDALRVLPRLRPGPGDLVYCDPPYLPASRRRPRSYRHDYTTADHRSLLELLLSLSCLVVLSGYNTQLYAELLSGWHRTDFRTQTHSGMATESLWTNFEPGLVLHDYSFVGTSFRERERLRRRIRSLSTRLAGAHPLERNAVLATLADAQPDALIAAAERAR